MEQIHFRPWENGTIGGEMKVPYPLGGKPAKKEIRTPTQYHLLHKGSLNFTSRKAENDRINFENVKLFQKLVQAQGSLNHQELSKDYRSHKKYK